MLNLSTRVIMNFNCLNNKLLTAGLCFVSPHLIFVKHIKKDHYAMTEKLIEFNLKLNQTKKI